jgi:hypothetical protein
LEKKYSASNEGDEKEVSIWSTQCPLTAQMISGNSRRNFSLELIHKKLKKRVYGQRAGRKSISVSIPIL